MFRRFLSAVAVKEQQPKALRRFWKTAQINEYRDGMYAIQLDDKFVKTDPVSGNVLVTKSQGLARLAAQEWQSQKSVIDSDKFQITSLLIRAQEVDRTQTLTLLSRYLDTDTICYHYTQPERLVKMQDQKWLPIINKLNQHFGIKIGIAKDLSPIEHDSQTLNTLLQIPSQYDNLKFVSFERAVLNSKSYLIGLSLMENLISVEEAVEAARLEVEFQTSQWGMVEDAHDVELATTTRALSSSVLYDL